MLHLRRLIVEFCFTIIDYHSIATNTITFYTIILTFHIILSFPEHFRNKELPWSTPQEFFACHKAIISQELSAYRNGVFSVIELANCYCKTRLNSLSAVGVVPVESRNTAVYHIARVVKIVLFRIIDHADKASALVLIRELASACISEICIPAVLSGRIYMIDTDALSRLYPPACLLADSTVVAVLCYVLDNEVFRQIVISKLALGDNNAVAAVGLGIAQSKCLCSL